MTKKIFAFFMVLLLCILCACENSGLFANQNQPWKDDAGHWHLTPDCGNHMKTVYITYYAHEEGESAYDEQQYYYYSHVKHYHVTNSSGESYVTVPVQKMEYECIYH